MVANTVNFMNECLDIQYSSFVKLAERFLSGLGTGELDKIPTIKVSELEHKMFNNYCTIIDVPYNNEEGYARFYCIGNSFVKLITT